MKEKTFYNSTALSKDKTDWATPQSLYEELNKEFNFTIDLCASDWNAKHERYYTKEDDALQQDWSGEVGFCNPPYGRTISLWVKKAYEESQKGGTIILLIPARTDTRYWHDYIFGKATDIRFLKGRVKFEDENGPRQPSPFPSAVVVYTP